MILINADDWGRARVDTDATLDCFCRNGIASTSAMVFMADSDRAARLALEHGIEVGLHLNLSEAYTAPRAESFVTEHMRIVRFLTSSKYALVLYHPDLRKAFKTVFDSQFAEFCRLYGKPPSHFDGHQHMHLCSNMVFNNIIPKGSRVRRNFSFAQGEKGFLNRGYRRWIDGVLARRFKMTDYFFSLESSLRNRKLSDIAGLSAHAIVEVMTHARRPDEFAFLTSPRCLDLLRRAGPVAQGETT